MRNERRKQSRRARGEGRPFKRGNLWWMQHYSHGQQIRESTGETDEHKAARVLRKRLGEVAAGIQRDSRGLRYEDLRGTFLADYEVNKRKSLRRNAKGNLYTDSLPRVDGFFSNWRAAEIDTDTLRSFIADEQKKGSANATINRALATLRRMFNFV